jgi:hypothetical protein
MYKDTSVKITRHVYELFYLKKLRPENELLDFFKRDHWNSGATSDFRETSK